MKWLKKYFKPMMFFSIVISFAVILISDIKNPDLEGEQLAKVNSLLNSEKEVVKSYVWNPDNRLSVGVIKDQVDPVVYASELCRKIQSLNASGVSISVIDVVKLQKSGGDDWDELGFVKCENVH
ncbi:MAG: hypothetical protein V7707_19825 [Motiliproteus sp.]